MFFVAPGSPSPGRPSRRRWALWTLGTLRFLFPNVLSEPPSKFKVGFPDAFEEGKVVERFKDQNIWVVRDEGKIYALSTTCTHLGCTPNWLEARAEVQVPLPRLAASTSPASTSKARRPRPLERWAIRIGDDGQLVVDKSRSSSKNCGQWDNPESFIMV